MESVELMLDEENELVFEVNVSGADSAKVSPKCRFMCQGKKMSFIFEGKLDDNNISVAVPPMKGMLAEGVYPARLEVLIDDRYFAPLDMQVEFKTALKVTAEAVAIKNSKATKPITEKLGATAKLINRPKQALKQVMSEKKSAAKKPSFMTLKQKFALKQNLPKG